MSKVRSLSKRLISLLCAAFTIAALMTVLPASIVASAATNYPRMDANEHTIYLTVTGTLDHYTLSDPYFMVQSVRYNGPMSHECVIAIRKNDYDFTRSARIKFYNNKNEVMNDYSLTQDRRGFYVSSPKIAKDGTVTIKVESKEIFRIAPEGFKFLNLKVTRNNNKAAEINATAGNGYYEFGRKSSTANTYNISFKVKGGYSYKKVNNHINDDTNKYLNTGNGNYNTLSVVIKYGKKYNAKNMNDKTQNTITKDFSHQNMLTFKESKIVLETTFSTVIGKTGMWTKMENLNWGTAASQDGGIKFLYWDSDLSGHVIHLASISKKDQTNNEGVLFSQALTACKDWKFTLSEDYSTMTLQKMNADGKTINKNIKPITLKRQ